MPETSAMVYSGANAPGPKSAIRKFYERVLGTVGSPTATSMRQHVHAGAHLVRQSGESLIVGGLLGVAHSKLQNGLDVSVANGKAVVPIDAAGAALAAVASIATAGEGAEGMATDLRNAAASGFTVFAFRKTVDFMNKKKAAGGGAPATHAGEGDFGEDPIIAAAKRL